MRDEIPFNTYKIFIVLDKFSLYVYKNTSLINKYSIAIGKDSTPTPTGNFKIVNKKILNSNVFGTRWLGLDKKSYGIHGTSTPSCLRKKVSLGCIRMQNKDIEELFNLVNINTPVHILHNNIHTISHGDTLYIIAKKYNLNADFILAQNTNLDIYNLKVGEKIKLF